VRREPGAVRSHQRDAFRTLHVQRHRGPEPGSHRVKDEHASAGRHLGGRQVDADLAVVPYRLFGRCEPFLRLLDAVDLQVAVLARGDLCLPPARGTTVSPI